MCKTDTGWAEATEQQVLDQALRITSVEGWTWPAAILAGKACGLSQGETELLLPRGPEDLAALLCRRHDAQALAALAGVEPAALKIRQRIAHALEARLDAAMVDEAAERRLAGFLALPHNWPLAARLSWESADVIWRWAGDTATDENHYSKRALLAGILTGALAIRLSSGAAAATTFIDLRIDNILALEAWKATTRLKPGAFVASLAGALGRMRFGRT